MSEAVITEDLFKELHDDYVSIKNYLKSAKSEQIEEEEFDDLHAKAKATADKMLLTTENVMKTIDINNKYYYRLLGIRSSILCEKSKLLTMSKLPEDAEGVLSKALNYLLDGALKPEISFIILRIINHFSYVLSVCERYDEAREMLEQGEKIYEMLKSDVGPDETPSFYTGDDLFVASLEMTARPETNEQVEHLVSNSLQMLGHVHNKQGRGDKFAEYQHRTLARQLLMREGDAQNWSTKASRLATHFLSKGMYREARTQLGAASHILGCYENELRTKEPGEDLNAKISEVNMRIANLGRAWVKYALKIVAASKQKLIADFCGDPFNAAKDLTVEESEAESDLEELLEGDSDEAAEEEEMEPTSVEDDQLKEEDEELFPEVEEPVADVHREDGDKAAVKEEENKEAGDVGKEKGDGDEVVNESGEGVKEKKEEEEKEGKEKAEEVVGESGEGIQVKEVAKPTAENVETTPNEIQPADAVGEPETVVLGEGISKIDIVNTKIPSVEVQNNEEDNLLPRRPSGNNIPVPLTDSPFTFPSLDLSEYESLVPCELIAQPEVARKFFSFLHSWQKVVISYYNPREYPTEYLSAAMDIIDVIRMMAFFETDIDMMYSVHKARYDGLEALCDVLSKLHPAEFLSASVDLFRELADVQLEMMGLNLRRLFMVTSETKLSDEEDEEDEEEEAVDQGVDTGDLGEEPDKETELEVDERDAKSEKEEGEIDEEDNNESEKDDTKETPEVDEDARLEKEPGEINEKVETEVEAKEADVEAVEEETKLENESGIILLNKSPAVEDLVAKLDST